MAPTWAGPGLFQFKVHFRKVQPQIPHFERTFPELARVSHTTSVENVGRKCRHNENFELDLICITQLNQDEIMQLEAHLNLSAMFAASPLIESKTG